jgi:hypothetical protein
MLCEQLEQTQTQLERLHAELEHLLANDPAVKGLQEIPEFGIKTVAVLRAELEEVARFACTDQVIAYAGLLISAEASKVYNIGGMGAPKKADWREERRKRAWKLKEQHWKQQDIAKALGVSEGAVSQWLLPRARRRSRSPQCAST